MKKYRRGWLLIVLVLFIGIGYYYLQADQFKKVSVDLVVGSDTGASVRNLYFNVNHPVASTTDVKSIDDYQASTPIDPPYQIHNYPINQTASVATVDVRMIDDMELNFTTLGYSRLGITRKATIGKVHMRFIKAKTLQEVSVCQETDQQILVVEVEGAPGEITNVSLVNSDVKASVKNIKKQSNGNYQYEIHYQVNTSFSRIHTTMMYTVKVQGKDQTYYGNAEAVFADNGKAGGNYVSGETTSFD